MKKIVFSILALFVFQSYGVLGETTREERPGWNKILKDAFSLHAMYAAFEDGKSVLLKDLIKDMANYYATCLKKDMRTDEEKELIFNLASLERIEIYWSQNLFESCEHKSKVRKKMVQFAKILKAYLDVDEVSDIERRILSGLGSEEIETDDIKELLHEIYLKWHINRRNAINHYYDTVAEIQGRKNTWKRFRLRRDFKKTYGEYPLN